MPVAAANPSSVGAFFRALTSIHPGVLLVVIVFAAINDFKKAMVRIVEKWLSGLKRQA